MGTHNELMGQNSLYFHLQGRQGQLASEKGPRSKQDKNHPISLTINLRTCVAIMGIG